MIATQERLQNPPIKEAVIDIQFSQPIEFCDVYGGAIDGFANPSILRTSQIEFRNEEGFLRAEGEPGSEMIGYRYDSEDNLFVLQLMRDRLTVSRLQPYLSWDDLVGKAREVWNLYFKAQVPLPISRVAVRYINALELEFEGHGEKIDFDRFLKNTPTVPEGYNGEIENFFSRFVVRAINCSDALANIIQTFNKLPQHRGIELIVDIDVYAEYPQPLDRSVWDVLEELRREKNHIFNNVMTDYALSYCK
jgi:uncharacterized protein (TIGR04255 family)